MKKLFLFAAVACAAMTANADYYLIGADVNGKSWTLKDDAAKFTEKSAGVYEVTIAKLGSSFKINDGTWTNPNVNFGSNGSKLALGEAYAYQNNANNNIEFANNISSVNNATVVLNTTTGTITVTGDTGEIIDPSAKDLYLIGNFNDWKLLDADYKMEKKGNVYTYTFADGISVAGWKINDGTWSSTDYNLGATDATNQPKVNEVYTLGKNGEDISLTTTGKTTVTVTLTDAGATLLVEADGGDTPIVVTYPDLYLRGEMNEWEAQDAYKFTRNENIYKLEVATLSGAWKIGSADWKVSFGEGGEPIVANQNNDVWYNSSNNFSLSNTEGKTYITLTVPENYIEAGVAATLFVDTVTAVENVEVAEGEAIYFNLQGVQVANPANGVYVKVLNGKASKVLLAD